VTEKAADAMQTTQNTMTNDNNTRKKANAVFFSVIMVLSMVAVGFAGFAGSAAAVDADNGDLTFNDQELVDEEVTISNVTATTSGDSADPEATAVVTYTNSSGFEIVAGFADANESDGDDIQVAIDDDSGFPGNHTAWLFADSDVGNVSVGQKLAGSDPENESALVDLANESALVVDESFDVSYDQADLHTGELIYQGQEVLVKNLTASQSYTLQEFVDTDTTRTRAQLSTGTDETFTTFTTEGRNSADYFISGSGSNGSESATFEIVTQELTAEFDEDSVDNRGSGAETFVTLESDLRTEYPVTVSADGDLTAEELEDIFGASNVESLDEDDDEISLGTVSDGDVDVDFDEIDAGDYEFTFSVDDTSAEDTASVTVKDVGEGELDVNPSSITQQQGDVVAINVTASEAASSGTLVIGNDEDVGYQANVSIDDFGDNDEITIYFNSYAAGNSSVDAGDTIWLDSDDADDDAEISFTDANQTLGIDQLDSGDYELAVSTSSSPSDTLETPDNIGSLFLEERSTAETINTWTVSDNVASEITSADEPVDALNERVGENVTQSSTIANGDGVIHQIEVSGLTGLLEATGEDTDAAQFEEALTTVVGSNAEAGFNGNSLDLRLRETRESVGPNAELRTVNLSATTFDVIVDSETDNLYVIVDTSTVEFENDDTLASDEEVELEARFRVQDARLLEFNRAEETNSDVEDLEDIYQTATGMFDIVEPEGDFAQDPYNVTNAEGQMIEGTTNLAPGTEVTLRVRSGDDTRPAFSNAETTTVAADGTWSAEFDFSEQNADDEYTVTLRNSLFAENPTVDGTVVETIVDGDDGSDDGDDGDDGNVTDGEDGDDGNVTDGEDGDDGNVTDGDDGTDDGSDGSDDGSDGSDGGDDGGDSEDGTPGFGALVALAALIAASLLPTRRNE